MIGFELNIKGEKTFGTLSKGNVHIIANILAQLLNCDVNFVSWSKI